MNRSKSIFKMTATALLIAIGIVIPMLFPKISIEPMSFTLASHVAVFLGMFISPLVAIGVTIGTTVGFLMSGLHYVVVLRAASHLLFVMIGSFYLKKMPETLQSWWKTSIFSFVIGIIHALAEVAVVSAFYFGGSLNDSFYAHGFANAVLLLVGLGTVAHSMVDFAIAILIYIALRQIKELRSLFVGT